MPLGFSRGVWILYPGPGYPYPIVLYSSIIKLNCDICHTAETVSQTGFVPLNNSHIAVAYFLKFTIMYVPVFCMWCPLF